MGDFGVRFSTGSTFHLQWQWRSWTLTFLLFLWWRWRGNNFGYRPQSEIMKMETGDVLKTTYYSSITTSQKKNGNHSNNVNHRSRDACFDGVTPLLWVVDDQPSDDEWTEEKGVGREDGYGLFLVSTSLLSAQLPEMENTIKKSLFSKHNTKCNYAFVFKTVRLTALVKDPKLYHLPLQDIYVISRKKRKNISRVADTYQTVHDSSSVRQKQNSSSLSPLKHATGK